MVFTQLLAWFCTSHTIFNPIWRISVLNSFIFLSKMWGIQYGGSVL